MTPNALEQAEAAFRDQSTLLFVRYTTLVSAGFSPIQAFELVKHQGLLLPPPSERNPDEKDKQ